MITATNEHWASVENLACSVCNQFVSKHGGNFDDALSTAYEVYVDCCKTWITGSAPFSNFFATCLYRRLLGEKQQTKRLPVVSISAGEVDYEIEEHVLDHSRVSDWMSTLKEDVRTLAQLALDTPAEVIAVFQAKGGQPRNMRSTLRDYLRAQGWTWARIETAFNEMKAAL